MKGKGERFDSMRRCNLRAEDCISECGDAAEGLCRLTSVA